jgi:acyl-CoA synthetase (AMP-forming)/AMP-acid ligase II
MTADLKPVRATAAAARWGTEPSPRSRTNLATIVASHALSRPDAVAVVDDSGQRTWAELEARVAGFAVGLSHRGVVKGDVVAVADSWSSDLIALYFATARVGAVLLPLNTKVPERTALSFLARTRPTLVLAAAPHGELTGRYCDQADAQRVTGSTDASWGDQLATVDSEDSVDSGASDAHGDLDDPHLIIFTSGTTGVPKAAVLSQGGCLADAYAAALVGRLRAEDRLYTYQPPHHAGTWSMIRHYLLVGGSVVLAQAFDAEAAVRALDRHRCTGMFAVPLVLQRLVEAESFPTADFSAFRRLVYASFDPSAVIHPVTELLRKRGATELRLEHIYGMTENSGYIAAAQHEACVVDPTSVGTPVPGVVISIQDPLGNDVPRGDTGEICVRSDSVMLGYLDNPEATDETFRGGWLRSGDLGQIDDSGGLHIVGRLKEMIRTAGVNVFPREIAEVLGAHPAVRDCCVFGVPDPTYDERVVAAVVADDASIAEADLIAWMRARLAGYQVPRQILFMTELPKTETGKTAVATLAREAQRLIT